MSSLKLMVVAALAASTVVLTLIGARSAEECRLSRLRQVPKVPLPQILPVLSRIKERIHGQELGSEPVNQSGLIHTTGLGLHRRKSLKAKRFGKMKTRQPSVRESKVSQALSRSGPR